MATQTGKKKPEPIGTAILEQFADLPVEGMTPAFARKLLKIGFAGADRDRVNELSDKAQDGTLTPAEDEVLDEYLRVADLLSILQSRARRALQNAGLAS